MRSALNIRTCHFGIAIVLVLSLTGIGCNDDDGTGSGKQVPFKSEDLVRVVDFVGNEARLEFERNGTMLTKLVIHDLSELDSNVIHFEYENDRIVRYNDPIEGVSYDLSYGGNSVRFTPDTDSFDRYREFTYEGQNITGFTEYVVDGSESIPGWKLSMNYTNANATRLTSILYDDQGAIDYQSSGNLSYFDHDNPFYFNVNSRICLMHLFQEGAVLFLFLSEQNIDKLSDESTEESTFDYTMNSSGSIRRIYFNKDAPPSYEKLTIDLSY